MTKRITEKDIEHLKLFAWRAAEAHRDTSVETALVLHDMDGVVDDIIKLLEFGGFIERDTATTNSTESTALKEA